MFHSRGNKILTKANFLAFPGDFIIAGFDCVSINMASACTRHGFAPAPLVFFKSYLLTPCLYTFFKNL